MSNQVYANSQLKFFPCPGIKSWATAAASIPNTATPTTIPYNVPILSQGPVGQVDVAAGVATFAEPGVYSVSAKISFQATTSPDNNFVDADFYLELRGGFAADQTKVSHIRNKFTDRGGAVVGSVDRIITLQYTGYFGAGDRVLAVCRNNRTATAIDILAADSGLLITKLI